MSNIFEKYPLISWPINNDRGLRTSRICVDYGVEIVLVCDAMVEKRGEGRSGFIAHSSARNQRIERMWSDFFEKEAEHFYERSYQNFNFVLSI